MCRIHQTMLYIKSIVYLYVPLLFLNQYTDFNQTWHIYDWIFGGHCDTVEIPQPLRKSPKNYLNDFHLATISAGRWEQTLFGLDTVFSQHSRKFYKILHLSKTLWKILEKSHCGKLLLVENLIVEHSKHFWRFLEDSGTCWNS